MDAGEHRARLVAARASVVRNKRALLVRRTVRVFKTNPYTRREVRGSRMFLRALGVERAVVESIGWENEEQKTPTMVVHARPLAEDRRRCPHCSRRCPGYDFGHGRRRWRLPDVGLGEAYLEAETARIECPEHGVVVRAVPWARHGSDFTYAFEDLVAWLVVRTDRTTVATMLRIAWRSVTAILERVAEAARARIDVLANVTKIGIDEVSYRKGHRYLTVVIDHDSGCLLWARPGRDERTVHAFFDFLGPERTARITLVSADAASWIGNAVRARCPNATLCLDPFHIVAWATKAVDDVRRSLWNRTRRAGDSRAAEAIKGTRWALLKNPEDLDGNQRVRLAQVQKHNSPLYRAYLLKEQLRAVFQKKGRQARNMLDYWLAWASRSKLEPFVKMARSVRDNRTAIDAVLVHRLSNARLESANTKFGLLNRLAFGFHSHARSSPSRCSSSEGSARRFRGARDPQVRQESQNSATCRFCDRLGVWRVILSAG